MQNAAVHVNSDSFFLYDERVLVFEALVAELMFTMVYVTHTHTK